MAVTVKVWETRVILSKGNNCIIKKMAIEQKKITTEANKYSAHVYLKPKSVNASRPSKLAVQLGRQCYVCAKFKKNKLTFLKLLEVFHKCIM